MVRWFVAGEDVQLGGSVLDQLLEAVVAQGRDFNAVLVWNYPRLSWRAARLVEVLRTLEAHGVDLVSASDSPRLVALEGQLDELAGNPDDESAG